MRSDTTYYPPRRERLPSLSLTLKITWRDSCGLGRSFFALAVLLHLIPKEPLVDSQLGCILPVIRVMSTYLRPGGREPLFHPAHESATATRVSDFGSCRLALCKVQGGLRIFLSTPFGSIAEGRKREGWSMTVCWKSSTRRRISELDRSCRRAGWIDVSGGYPFNGQRRLETCRIETVIALVS